MVQFLPPFMVVQMLVGRPPPSRLPRPDVGAVHLIDFLETESFCLGYEEVGVDEADEEHAKEDK